MNTIIDKLPIILGVLSTARALDSNINGIATPFIIGGQPATTGLFPHQASLRNAFGHFCSGSVITDRWILTAARCIRGYPIYGLSVHLGTDKLNETGTVYQAVLLIAHPNYSPYNAHANNVGLIKLNDTIIFDEFVQPVTLPLIDYDRNLYPAVVAGWGLTSYNGLTIPNELQYIETRLLSRQACAARIPMGSYKICAYTPTRGICNINQTEEEELPDATVSLLSLLLVGLLQLLLIFLSVAGNVLVIVAICTDRALRRIGNLFLASLAVADLFVGCLVMTFAGVNDLLGYWVFGSGFCDTWVAFDVMCSTASILNLCAISLDRYIHIKDPLRYQMYVTKRVAWASILTVWLMAILISFLPISLGLHRPNEPPVVHVVGDKSYPTCALDLTPTYAIVSSCISFYVPCIVMISIYCRLYCYAQKHVKSIKATTKLSQPSSLTKSFRSRSKRLKQPKQQETMTPKATKPTSPYHVSDHKAAITVGVIMGVFLICWVPFFCVNIVAAFCKTCIPDLAFQILTWLGYSNSTFNPIIYSIFNTEFREAFKRILTRGTLGRYNQPSTSECGEFRSVIVAKRNGSIECNISPRSSADSQMGSMIPGHQSQRHRDTIVSAI